MMERENTATLWLGNESTRNDEVLLESMEELGICPADLECVQHDSVQRCVHLKLHARSAQKLPAPDLYEMTREDGTIIHFVVTLNGQRFVSATVKNLPPEIPQEEVGDVLNDFGSVLWTVENCFQEGPFKGIKNGDRTALMILSTDIPSFIVVKNCEAKVEYRGQPKTCRRCGVRGHLQATCRTQPGTAKATDSDATPLEPAEPSAGDVKSGGGPPPSKQADDAPRAASSQDHQQQPVTAAARGVSSRLEKDEDLFVELRREKSEEDLELLGDLYRREKKIEKRKEKTARVKKKKKNVNFG